MRPPGQIPDGRAYSHLLQRTFVALLADLHGHGNISIRHIGHRRGSRLSLAVPVQPLALDDGREVLVADVQIDVAVDTIHASLLAVLPDAVSTAVAGLVHPMRQPDGVTALDVVRRVCGQRRSRAVQTDEVSRRFHSFKERPHDRRHLLLAEGKLLFPNYDLDLLLIWNKQSLPETVQRCLLAIAEKVFYKITDQSRRIINVTQWCKKQECWDGVKNLNITLPRDLKVCLTDSNTSKAAESLAKKDQRLTNDINAEVEVAKHSVDFWKRLAEFAVMHHIADMKDQKALTAACSIPATFPSSAQSKRLLVILEKAKDEGFKDE